MLVQKIDKLLPALLSSAPLQARLDAAQNDAEQLVVDRPWARDQRLHGGMSTWQGCMEECGHCWGVQDVIERRAEGESSPHLSTLLYGQVKLIFRVSTSFSLYL